MLALVLGPVLNMLLRAVCLMMVLCASAAAPNVLVTGATGRTGQLLYAALKRDARIGAVKAMVTNVTKARLVLNCSKCDASSGSAAPASAAPGAPAAAPLPEDELRA